MVGKNVFVTRFKKSRTKSINSEHKTGCEDKAENIVVVQFISTPSKYAILNWKDVKV